MYIGDQDFWICISVKNLVFCCQIGLLSTPIASKVNVSRDIERSEMAQRVAILIAIIICLIILVIRTVYQRIPCIWGYICLYICKTNKIF